jgi:hypothetical protein
VLRKVFRLPTEEMRNRIWKEVESLFPNAEKNELNERIAVTKLCVDALKEDREAASVCRASIRKAEKWLEQKGGGVIS